MCKLHLTKYRLIPYTRYSEVVEAISKSHLVAQALLPAQYYYTNLMKGDGKHGYSNQVA